MIVGAGLKPARNSDNNQTENSVSNIRHLENPQTSVCRKAPNGENRNMGKL